MFFHVRDQQEIEHERNRRAYNRNPGADMGFINELVPDRQIGVNPQKKIGQDNKRNDFHRFPIRCIADHEHLEQIGEHNHGQHDQRAENDKIFGHCGIGLPGVVIAGVAEEKRFDPERIRGPEQHHEQSEFVAGRINPDLGIGDIGRQQLTQQDLIELFVDGKGDSGD